MATLIPQHSLNNNALSDTDITENHPIVGDRVIAGEGTTPDAWQQWQGLADLPRLNIAKNFPKSQRVCIFAPHPDDEILGCGGLMQQLVANGNPIMLVSVTNGTQSHPESDIYPPDVLNTVRPQETQAALKVLTIANRVTRIALELSDGAVYQQQAQFYQKLENLLHTDDILITTFVHDGHPDHEATGQVVTDFAKTHGLSCYQVLIWAWHWAQPADSRIPWAQAWRLDLTANELDKKRHAIACFTSQITPDTSTGNAPILSTQTLARISQPWEVYLFEPVL